MAAGKSAKPRSMPDQPTAADGARFLETLLSRTTAEDVGAYRPDALQRAAELARTAVARHKKGESVIAIDRDTGIEATAVR